ncbi:MAG: hypothetical protein MMC33_004683 [Icmadophila ericetorum]|nr:hypothetical protein [Icmadophila ericetorum]
MSDIRKYAGLPDIDAAPDIYETPELTDDNSTRPTSRTLLSDSRASSPEGDGIDGHRLDPDEARSRFLPATVDARDVNFSDQIGGRRRAYRISNRRVRKNSTGEEELSSYSDGEDTSVEGLNRRIARLLREAQEVKAEIARRQETGEAEEASELDKNLDAGSLSQLNNILENVDGSMAGRKQGASERLLQKVKGTSSRANGPTKSGASKDSKLLVTYAPNFKQQHTLAKVADFDARLQLLETVLGTDSMPLSIEDRPSVTTVLPTLDKLNRQLSLLSSSSASSLDAVKGRIRQLTQDAERLDEARRSAKAAQDALLEEPQNSNSESKTPIAIEDPEQTSKINALYGTLHTIETVAPVLPSVLERLRSLRLIHSDAANASQNLAAVEKRQAEMADDIKTWREGLEKVEEAITTGEGKMTGNMEVVERWVKDLEERMIKLEI